LSWARGRPGLPSPAACAATGAGRSYLSVDRWGSRGAVATTVSTRTPHCASPGMPTPRSCGSWVARDDLVRYPEAYAKLHGLDVRTQTPVERIEHKDRKWELVTPAGRIAPRAVVVATGLDAHPFLPAWPGRERFRGQLVHSGMPSSQTGHGMCSDLSMGMIHSSPVAVSGDAAGDRADVDDVGDSARALLGGLQQVR
jgi:Pyridine nucleotide-disulphide oxidoreductase